MTVSLRRRAAGGNAGQKDVAADRQVIGLLDGDGKPTRKAGRVRSSGTIMGVGALLDPPAAGS